MASDIENHPYASGPNGTYQLEKDQETSSADNCIASQISEKPISSVAVAVGAGIGVGLLLTAVFSSERSRRERLAGQVGRYLQSRIGSVSNLLPDKISDRFG